MATELRPDIQSAKDRISTCMGAGREFKKLESYLWEGEVVDSVCVGQYGRGTGLLVLTNSRLLFLVDGMTGSTFEDFPLSKITSVQWSSGFVQGTLTVYASGNKAEINNVAKPDGPPLADKVRRSLPGTLRRSHPHHRPSLRRRLPSASADGSRGLVSRRPEPHPSAVLGRCRVDGAHRPTRLAFGLLLLGVPAFAFLELCPQLALLPTRPVRPSHTAPDGHSHRERPRVTVGAYRHQPQIGNQIVGDRPRHPIVIHAPHKHAVLLGADLLDQHP